MVQTIIVKCAWCGKDIGAKDGEGVSGISHGICEECLEKELSKLDKIEKKPMPKHGRNIGNIYRNTIKK